MVIILEVARERDRAGEDHVAFGTFRFFFEVGLSFGDTNAVDPGQVFPQQTHGAEDVVTQEALGRLGVQEFVKTHGVNGRPLQRHVADEAAVPREGYFLSRP